MLRAVCTRAQVQRLNESRLTIRGMGIRTLSPLRSFWQGPSYSPNRLVGVQCLRNDLYKAVKGPSTRPSPLDDHWVNDIEGVSLFSSPTRWNSLRLWPSLVLKQDHRRRSGEWYIFLKRYCTKFGQKFRVWPKELSKRFPKLVISVTLCQ